jgi:hypothetical protein
MKKISFLIVLAIALLVIACGRNNNQPSISNSEEQISYILRDTAIYGFCAEGSAMNTLQIITDAGDTITVSTAKAREKEQVFGGYAIGDEIALIANADTTQAIMVINKSMLNGDWVMPNPVDGSNETGVRILRGGVCESIDQSSIIYKTWRIFNGRLQFTITREDGIDMEEYLIYDIVKLTEESLVLRSTDEDKELFEYTRPSVEEYTEKDLKGVELDDGYDDEFNMQ